MHGPTLLTGVSQVHSLVVSTHACLLIATAVVPCTYVGGSGGGWKKRYFVLEDCTLRYFKTEESKKPKGCIKLNEGRGVRQREQCKVEWPSEAKEDLCFGVATESRTYYVYATDMQSVQ